MPSIRTTTLLRASMCALLAIGAMAEEQQPAPRREETILVKVTAKVETIDQATREVTLKGPLGNTVTFTAGEQIKRLNEVAAGDEVTAEYYISIAGELRAPTEEEKKNPISIGGAEGRTAKTALPGGLSAVQVKILATIVGLDLPTQMITLQGPKGRNAQIRAASIDNLMKLHLGESVIVTYTEAVAVSLSKSKPAAQ